MFRVIHAEYADKDVTEIVENHVHNNSINIIVGNTLFGDHKPFIQKSFCIEYSMDGQLYKTILNENDVFRIAEDNHKFLSVSCKCITYGRIEFLEESIESFLRQEYPGEYELVIVNDYPKQKLIYNHPKIRIYNLDFTFNTIGEKENFAISACKYENIAVWDDDDLALPNHLLNINKYFRSYDLLHWQNGVAFVTKRIAAIHSLGNSGIVYTKNIWQRMGGHAFENAGYDTTFVQKVTKSGGRIARAFPPNNEVSWFYTWGNGTYHMSGMGADNDSRPNVVVRHSDHIERLRAQGKIPTGDIILNPHWEQDYQQMLKEYCNEQNN